MTAQNEGDPKMMSPQELEAIREWYEDVAVFDHDPIIDDIPALLSHIEAQDAELATLRQLVDSSYVLREKPWRGLDKEAQP